MLDTKGLVALWREGLGAQKALLYLERGQRFGYQSHPQLQRFKDSDDPLASIAFYLHEVHVESIRRGYRFNASLILPDMHNPVTCIAVTSGQVQYEYEWLQEKLALRLPGYEPDNQQLSLHPLFSCVPGAIEPWEVIRSKQ